MIYVGIDVAKDKHDCFIMNSEGEVLFKPFVIRNNRAGFDSLYEKICSAAESPDKIGFADLRYQSVTYQSLQKKSKP